MEYVTITTPRLLCARLNANTVSQETVTAHEQYLSEHKLDFVLNNNNVHI